MIFNITWVFWENNYVVGYKDFMVKFGGYNKTGLFLQVISIHIFLYGQCTEWDYFWGLLKFHIFWGYASYA